MPRKISEAAVHAFMNALPFKRSNTEVEISPNGLVVLYLHGNDIAQRQRHWQAGVMQVCDGGYSSNTTKERLNALPGVRVHQKDWQWHLNDVPWDGTWVWVYPNLEGYVPIKELHVI